MMENLEDTEVHEQKKQGRIINASSSGLGPVIGVLIPITPFLLEGTLLTMLQATISSVILAVLLLGAFATYMASISQQKWFKAAPRMGLAGVVVALLNILLPG